MSAQSMSSLFNLVHTVSLKVWSAGLSVSDSISTFWSSPDMRQRLDVPVSSHVKHVIS